MSQIAGQAASSVAKDAFTSIADDFGQAAASMVNWLWGQIGAASSVHLGGSGFNLDWGIVTAIAAVVAVGLFVIQIIVSVLRRDGGGLARAGRGLLVAFLGAAAAIGVVDLLLSAVDALSNGVVQAATGEPIAKVGPLLVSATALTASTDPAAMLLLALVAIAAVVIVWFAMTVRKLLIVVTAVFAPLAFAGSLADLSSSWVRRWIETTVALVVSKLILVMIFVVGLGVLVNGAGQTPGANATGPSQAFTQTAAGLLILCLAGLAPWLALRLVHFSGEHFAQLHAHAGAVSSAPAQVITAPRKLQSHFDGLGSTVKGANSSPGQPQSQEDGGRANEVSSKLTSSGSAPTTGAASGMGDGGGTRLGGRAMGAPDDVAHGGFVGGPRNRTATTMATGGTNIHPPPPPQETAPVSDVLIGAAVRNTPGAGDEVK